MKQSAGERGNSRHGGALENLHGWIELFFERLDVENERLNIGIGQDAAIGGHADVFGIVAFGDFGGRVEDGLTKILGGGFDGLSVDEFAIGARETFPCWTAFSVG